MTPDAHPSKVAFVREHSAGEPPDRPRCAVCRDPVRRPSLPAGRIDNLFICVLCWFDGGGREFWKTHRPDARSLVICPRVDGQEPEYPNAAVTEAEFTFVVEDGPP